MKIIVADIEKNFVGGIVNMLSSKNIEITGVAMNVADLIMLAEINKPDAIVMGKAMQLTTDRALIAELKKINPKMDIITTTLDFAKPFYNEQEIMHTIFHNQINTENYVQRAS